MLQKDGNCTCPCNVVTSCDELEDCSYESEDPESCSADTTLPSLDTLILNDNPLTNLPRDLFTLLEGSPVQFLRLYNCSVRTIHAGVFRVFTDLATLDLSMNPHMNLSRVGGGAGEPASSQLAVIFAKIDRQSVRDRLVPGLLAGDGGQPHKPDHPQPQQQLPPVPASVPGAYATGQA